MKKILVVDDMPVNLLILKKILSEKYEIHTAENGYSALDLLEKEHPDLILLDIMMPELDGFSTCKKIKNNKKFNDIPILFLTAKTDEESIVEAFEIGGSDYLKKPFNTKELFARIKNHLDLSEAKKKLAEQANNLKDLNFALYKKNKEMEDLAKIDYLTKLPNRRYMYDKLKEEISRYERHQDIFSIIMCDIDNFKPVNDSYGHECGDFILIELAKLFENNKRKYDSIARWGGEEFLYLLPITNKNQAMVFTEHMRKTIENKNFVYNNKKINITLSFGISEYMKNDDIKETIKKADSALYYSKNNGKNMTSIFNCEIMGF